MYSINFETCSKIHWMNEPLDECERTGMPHIFFQDRRSKFKPKPWAYFFINFTSTAAGADPSRLPCAIRFTTCIMSSPPKHHALRGFIQRLIKPMCRM